MQAAAASGGSWRRKDRSLSCSRTIPRTPRSRETSDADAWIQRWDALSSYVENALRIGFAITPESDPAYDLATIMKANEASFAIFGLEYLDRLHATGTANAGAFAGRADAPHWHAWRRSIEANIDKAKGSSHLLFMLDQTALCIVCGQGDLETVLLPTTCNWITDHALPIVSDHGAVLLRPLSPHEPIGIVHPTSYHKRAFLSLSRLGGGSLSRTLSYQAHSQLAADEYVSPGRLERCRPRGVCVGRMRRGGDLHREKGEAERPGND